MILVSGIFPFTYHDEMTFHLIQTFILGIIAGILSYKAKFLTLGGAIIASVLTIALFGFGGMKWLFPMVTFFILSSILSKLRSRLNPGVENFFEKSGIRDYKQVLANGGIAFILILLNYIFEFKQIYLAYIGLLSVVCADTWSTEFGTIAKVKTYNVINLKPVEQGTSGGISALGLIGSLLGSLTIALSAFFWVGRNLIPFIMIVIFAGLFGNIIDSFLGASFQVQYKCIRCHLKTEKKAHCNTNTEIFRGIKWVDNDFVNLISGLTGCIFILIFQHLF